MIVAQVARRLIGSMIVAAIAILLGLTYVYEPHVARGRAITGLIVSLWVGLCFWLLPKRRRDGARAWHVAKWIATCVCVLSAALVGICVLHNVAWLGGGGTRLLTLEGGYLGYSTLDASIAKRGGWGRLYKSGWNVKAPDPLTWFGRLGVSRTRISASGYVHLSLPLLATLFPALMLWWPRRLSLPGHCAPCGYDLTGNVSGVCPECGEKV